MPEGIYPGWKTRIITGEAKTDKVGGWPHVSAIDVTWGWGQKTGGWGVCALKPRIGGIPVLTDPVGSVVDHVNSLGLTYSWY
jgi:hypothetical protein